MTKRVYITLFFLLMILSLGSCVPSPSSSRSGGSRSSTSTTNSSSESRKKYYDAGYERGFDNGFSGVSAGSVEKSARISFTGSYGAPSTDEKKKQFDSFLAGYTDGYAKGKSSR